MTLAVKVLRVVFVFCYMFFFGALYTVLKFFVGNKQNEELRQKARQLNIDAAKKMDCGAQSIFVTLPTGIKLHVVEAGDRSGKLIVLLHGFPDVWHCWSGVIPTLVKQGYFVVAPDMRGYNLSDKPLTVADYKINNLVGDIKQLIEHYNKKDSILVAHDWGGVVAWALAERHPEILEKLIILNAPHAKRYMEVVKKNIRQGLSSWYILFFQIPIIPLNLMTFNPLQTAKSFLQTRNKGAVSSESLQILASSYAQENEVSSMLNYYKALFRAQIQAAWNAKKIQNRERREGGDKVKVPTLVLWGENDTALIRELGMCSRYVEHVNTIYIPNCSHWVPYEAPEIVSREILKFIK